MFYGVWKVSCIMRAVAVAVTVLFQTLLISLISERAIGSEEEERRSRANKAGLAPHAS